MEQSEDSNPVQRIQLTDPYKSINSASKSMSILSNIVLACSVWRQIRQRPTNFRKTPDVFQIETLAPFSTNLRLHFEVCVFIVDIAPNGDRQTFANDSRRPVLSEWSTAATVVESSRNLRERHAQHAFALSGKSSTWLTACFKSKSEL